MCLTCAESGWTGRPAGMSRRYPCFLKGRERPVPFQKASVATTFHRLLSLSKTMKAFRGLRRSVKAVDGRWWRQGSLSKNRGSGATAFSALSAPSAASPDEHMATLTAQGAHSQPYYVTNRLFINTHSHIELPTDS